MSTLFAEEIIKAGRNTMQPLELASHSPSAIYSSPEIYELEREHIFFKDWICCGRVEMLEQPGDYLAFDLMGEPILVVRNKTGQLSAFSNVCLHRGVALVEPGCGHKRAFSCPFHGWTYSLDGRLIMAPRMEDTACFNLAERRLPEIQVGQWHGWIFVNFDPVARSLDQHVQALEKDFAFLRQDECRLGITTINEVQCNWKLVVENIIDLYHVNLVHKSTNGRQFTAEQFRFSARDEGGYYATFNSGPSTLTGAPVFGKIPWLSDYADDFSATGRLRPNYTLFARIDTVHVFLIWPLAPTKTRITVHTLLPKIYFESPDFDQRVTAYRDYQNKVIAEDRAVLEKMQAGIASRLYRPGRMAAIECGVHHIEKDYIERLTGILDPQSRLVGVEG